MKKYLLLAINALILLSLFSTNAFAQGQNTTQGKDFWLSFGYNEIDGSPSTLQVRIVATKTTSVKLTYTHNNTSKTFNVNAGQVYTYTLSAAEKALVYNNATGISKKSMHIASDENVSVFAVNLAKATTDATNVLPTTNYGMSYYHMSYQSIEVGIGDGYTVIANEDNTVIKENGTTMATLNKGQVYSRYAGVNTDLTGKNITSDKPIAYFTTNACVRVPAGNTACDCLFQQQVPVFSWGNNFLIPITKRGIERIRIVASQDGTTINQIGGSIVAGVGAASLTLNAGQFVELEAKLVTNGCYIKSDKPVAVGSYLIGTSWSALTYKLGDPAMAWVPPIEQTVMNVAIAPFIAKGTSILTEHHALIITPTATKTSTTMTIGAGAPQALSGGTWSDNNASGYSFYSIPLTTDATYYFENAAGLSVMGYGLGQAESYYYLAASSARQLNPSFYINDIHFQDADGQSYCKGPFHFKAVANMTLSGAAGHIKWYINDVEVADAQDKVEWTKTDFPLDIPQEIKLVIVDIYGQEFVMYSTITVVDPQPLTITGSPYICPPETSTILTAQDGPTYYQWFKNGVEILGATQNTYKVTSENAGDYTVVGYYGTCVSPISDTITVVNGCEPTLTVTYDGNEQTGGTPPTDPNVYNDNVDVTVLAHGDLVKTGAVFIGWSFDKKNLITAQADVPTDLMAAGDQFKIMADVTLYAVWGKDTSGPGGESDSIPDYLQKSVTYNGNDQTSGTVPVDNNVYNSGNNVTVKAHGNLKKTGATFIGWSFGKTNLITAQADEPTDLMAAGDQFTITTDTTLYAVWAKDTSGPGGESDSIPDYLQKTVLYDGNGQTGGTAPIDAYVYNNGDNVTVKAHGDLVKTGTVFIGWSFGQTNIITAEADEPADLMVAGDQFAITTDTTLYAVWAKDTSGPGGESDSIPDYLQLAVIYDGNGATGTAPVDANVYNNGNSVTVKANSGLAKAGATFIGWSFDQTNIITAEADEPADLMVAGDQFAITVNTTLYAVWAADVNGPDGPDVPGGGGDSIPDYLQFAVTYNGNGNLTGTVPVDPAIYSSTDIIIAKANTGNLARTTKVIFAGWTPTTPVAVVVTPANAQDTTTAFVRAGGQFSINGNTTMYAVWASDDNENNIPDIFEDGYNVYYNANGATTGTAPVDAAIYVSGVTVTTKDKGDLERTNALFIGWSSSISNLVVTPADLPAGLILEGATFTISGTVTLYAVWAQDVNGPDGPDNGGDGTPDYLQFSVTYYGNGEDSGAAPIDLSIYDAGHVVTLKDKGSLAKDNAAFIGWTPTPVTYIITTQAQEDALTAMKKPDSTFTIAGNTYWHAVWGEDNNGNGVPDYKEVYLTFSQGVLAASAIAGLPETIAVEKGVKTKIEKQANTSGFVLLGWNTLQVAAVTTSMIETLVTKTLGKFYAVGDSILVMDDMTLYAVWARDANNDGYPDYGSVIIKPQSIKLKRATASDNEEATLYGATDAGVITGTRVWAYDKTLYIESDKAVCVRIYTIGGMLYKQMDISEGLTTEPLSGGVYIIEIDGTRHKVVVK